MNKILSKQTHTEKTNEKSIHSEVTKYVSLRDQIKMLESELEQCKSNIIDTMQNSGDTTCVSGNYKIELKRVKTQRMLKINVPDEIWNKYSKETLHESLFVTLNTKNTRSKN